MSDSMRIGLVAIGGAGWMGGAHYVRNLARAIRVAEPEHEIQWFCGQSLASEWHDVAPRFDVPNQRGIVARLFGDRHAVRKAVERSGARFIYPLTYDNEYNLGLSFPVGQSLGTAAWAGWVPDYQHRYLPELFSSQEIEWRESRIAQLVAEARTVVHSSQSAQGDFEKFYPAHARKGRVLSFAVPPIPPAGSDEDAGEVPERFLLVCNQFWRHKNHLTLFEALGILRSRGVRPQVLCTGQLAQNYRDGDYAGEVRAALQAGGIGEQVQLLGLVPRPRQIALMRRAVAIVQPSLFEGWSTVVEDARVLGRRCVLSDLEVHREQGPPGATYFPARSAEGLADVLAEVWSHWSAGPDREAEDAARAEAERRLLAVGRTFLSLAREAVQP